MILFLAKILFRLLNPQVIFIAGQYRMTAAAALVRILLGLNPPVSAAYINFSHSHWRSRFFWGLAKGARICCFAGEIGDGKEERTPGPLLRFLQTHSSQYLFVITGVSDTPLGVDVFASEKAMGEPYVPIVKRLRKGDGLVLFDDDVTIRDLKDEAKAQVKTFGFHEDADVFISNPALLTDEKFLGEKKETLLILNAKLNTNRQAVPIWLTNALGRVHLYGVAAAAACASMIDGIHFNFVEVSEALKLYRAPQGFLRIIRGNREGVIIIDDSADATIFSMLEAVEALADFQGRKRIAVLGDLVGPEAEAALRNVTVQAVKHCEILIAVGTKAVVVRDEAVARGFPAHNIQTASTVSEAIEFLRKIIQGGEVILIDGAKELGLWRIVEALAP